MEQTTQAGETDIKGGDSLFREKTKCNIRSSPKEEGLSSWLDVPAIGV